MHRKWKPLLNERHSWQRALSEMKRQPSQPLLLLKTLKEILVGTPRLDGQFIHGVIRKRTEFYEGGAEGPNDSGSSFRRHILESLYLPFIRAASRCLLAGKASGNPFLLSSPVMFLPITKELWSHCSSQQDHHPPTSYHHQPPHPCKTSEGPVTSGRWTLRWCRAIGMLPSKQAVWPLYMEAPDCRRTALTGQEKPHTN